MMNTTTSRLLNAGLIVTAAVLAPAAVFAQDAAVAVDNSSPAIGFSRRLAACHRRIAGNRCRVSLRQAREGNALVEFDRYDPPLIVDYRRSQPAELVFEPLRIR